MTQKHWRRMHMLSIYMCLSLVPFPRTSEAHIIRLRFIPTLTHVLTIVLKSQSTAVTFPGLLYNGSRKHSKSADLHKLPLIPGFSRSIISMCRLFYINTQVLHIWGCSRKREACYWQFIVNTGIYDACESLIDGRVDKKTRTLPFRCGGSLSGVWTPQMASGKAGVNGVQECSTSHKYPPLLPSHKAEEHPAKIQAPPVLQPAKINPRRNMRSP